MIAFSSKLFLAKRYLGYWPVYFMWTLFPNFPPVITSALWQWIKRVSQLTELSLLSPGGRWEDEARYGSLCSWINALLNSKNCEIHWQRVPYLNASVMKLPHKKALYQVSLSYTFTFSETWTGTCTMLSVCSVDLFSSSWWSAGGDLGISSVTPPPMRGLLPPTAPGRTLPVSW